MTVLYNQSLAQEEENESRDNVTARHLKQSAMNIFPFIATSLLNDFLHNCLSTTDFIVPRMAGIGGDVGKYFSFSVSFSIGFNIGYSHSVCVCHHSTISFRQNPINFTMARISFGIVKWRRNLNRLDTITILCRDKKKRKKKKHCVATLYQPRGTRCNLWACGTHTKNHFIGNDAKFIDWFSCSIDEWHEYAK